MSNRSHSEHSTATLFSLPSAADSQSSSSLPLKQGNVAQVSPLPTSNASDNRQQSAQQLPSFIDVHQFLVRDMNMTSPPLEQRQQHQSNVNPSFYSSPTTSWQQQQPKFQDLSQNGNHQVYPSPEEKSPPTPAGSSFLLNSPPPVMSASSSRTSNTSSFNNSSMSNYHPMNVPSGYPIDQDAMVSLLFTKPGSSAVDHHHQQSTPSSYGSHHQNHNILSDRHGNSTQFYHPLPRHASLSSSYGNNNASAYQSSSYGRVGYPQSSNTVYQTPSSSASSSYYNQQQQQDVVGPLRINTRQPSSNSGGMASSLASSLASAHSMDTTSFFSSPLSESMYMSPNNAASMSLKKRKSQGAIRTGSSSNGKSSSFPYHLSNNPEDQPREQRLKFPGDMYTPKWVRLQGAAKEGLCDLCDGPGKWLQLKNSAFWYHKQFVHGISSVTSLPFSNPTDTRLVWMSEVIANRHCVFLASEGFCSCCNEWIPLSKNRKRHSQTFDTKEEAIALLSTTPLGICCYEPAVKSIAARDQEGNLVLPQGMKVTSSMVRDLVGEPLGSTWFRHAFKCHAAAAAASANAAAANSNNMSMGTMVTSSATSGQMQL